MEGKLFCWLLLLGTLAMTDVAAQNDGKEYSYSVKRMALAMKTFKELAAMCAGSDQYNLATDYLDCDKAVEGRDDLRAAMLENIIFDYCNVPDSLKTNENREAWELCGKSYFTLRERECWFELGRSYLDARLLLEAEEGAKREAGRE